MENDPAAKPNKRQIDETIAQDCEANTNSDFDLEAGAIPATVGRYEIDRLLGRGGMGSVYLARDTNLQREVALKVPKFSSETNPKLIDRFYREARSAANLSHPNLCPVFDVGEIDGTHYIAMAYIKGRPLSEYVQPDKPPELRAAATIIRKVAIAMEDAHKSGILHRDLKPANIMIDHRKEPIVMDFGLACPQNIGEDTRLTREGTLLGSPAYMPPEQLTGRNELIGPASDVYSLGVVLYELLTGRLPFDGVESTIALIGRVLSESPQDIMEVRPEIDAGLATVCRKAMAKDVSERYPSMKAFAKDLSLYLRSGGHGTSGKEDKITLADPKARPEAKTIRLQEQTKLVKTLCKTGQIEAASQLLKEIVADPDAKDSESGRWAASMIPKVQSRLTQQMSVTKTRAEASQAKAAPASQANDPFADLPSAAAGTPVAPTPAFYTRPQRAATGSSKSGQPKWLVPAVIATACLAVAGLGSFLWYNRPPGPTPSYSVETSETPVPASDTAETDQRETGRRDPGRPRFAEGSSPQRDTPLRANELFELDTDGDGKVSLSQLSDAQRRKFRVADRNDDGFLDEAEIEEMERRRPRLQEGFNDRPGPRGGPPNGPRGRDSFEPGPRGPQQ